MRWGRLTQEPNACHPYTHLTQIMQQKSKRQGDNACD